eukprot:TRINITY_DN4893_c0_g3_i1.p1 TRINITY_DN4893_c0_g3~~TRINITY_DN4893_c0_g3_i1.p1  ORF type:complete len:491 (-),score=113.99 TRINITY_DN4893_c0_g3_i1:25-1497(-)
MLKDTELDFIRLSKYLVFASAEDDRNVVLFDPRNLGILEVYEDEAPLAPKSMVYSKEYGYLLGKNKTKTILNFWKMKQTKPLQKCPLPENIMSLALSSSQVYCLGGGQSGSVYIWSTLTGDIEKKFVAHNKGVLSLRLSGDDSLVFTASEDASIKVWTLVSIFGSKSDIFTTHQGRRDGIPQPLYTLLGHIDRVTNIWINSNLSDLLASVSADRTARIWDISKGIEIKKLSFDSALTSCVFDSQEEFLFIGNKKGVIKSVKLHDQTEIFSDEGEAQPIRDSKLTMVDFIGHKGEVTCLAFESEGYVLISGGEDKQIIIWSVNGTIVKTLNLLTSAISNLLIIERPAEYQKEDTRKKSKRPISFSPFSKFEEAKKSEKRKNDPIFLEKNDGSVDILRDLRKCRENMSIDNILLEEFSNSLNSNPTTTSRTMRSEPKKENDSEQSQEIEKLKDINRILFNRLYTCLLYTSDAADDLLCVDLGGRRIIKKKNI